MQRQVISTSERIIGIAAVLLGCLALAVALWVAVPLVAAAGWTSVPGLNIVVGAVAALVLAAFALRSVTERLRH